MSETRTAGIPTATNVDHVAWTVPDLDAAVRFFVEVLGGEELFRAGPFNDPTGNWMSEQFDVPARASGALAMVRLGPSQVVELLEWETDDQDGAWPRNDHLGATHIAIQVGDIKAAGDYLRSHGCTPCGEPVPIENMPHTGITIQYVRTPISLYLELVHTPNTSLPYEATSAARLLPSAPAWTNA